MPPSTCQISPVTYVEHTCASTTSATSSGEATRASGFVATARARASSHDAVHGLSPKPGAPALTRTAGASVAARSRVWWCSAALLAAYGIEEPTAREPAIEPMLTMTPPPGAAASHGRAAV